jgi:hypothetical protein
MRRSEWQMNPEAFERKKEPYPDDDDPSSLQGNGL